MTSAVNSLPFIPLDVARIEALPTHVMTDSVEG